MGPVHHITIGGDPWCSYSGCRAGEDIRAKAEQTLGRRLTCSHLSKDGAEAAAKALIPHFRVGVVDVVAGPCPEV